MIRRTLIGWGARVRWCPSVLRRQRQLRLHGQQFAEGVGQVTAHHAVIQDPNLLEHCLDELHFQAFRQCVVQRLGIGDERQCRIERLRDARQFNAPLGNAVFSRPHTLPNRYLLGLELFEGEHVVVVGGLGLLPPLFEFDEAALLLGNLGRYAPVSNVVEQLLAPGGLFGTLDEIERYGEGAYLEHLAVVAPVRTVEHIGRLIAGVSLEELRQRSRIRRSLVFALEKLAWHTTTFREAAQALLRLALAENETYANNATGAWTALFGIVLPVTAASPEERLTYLGGLVNDNSPHVRVVSCGMNRAAS